MKDLTNKNSKTKKIIMSIGSVVAIVLIYYLLSPLFISTEINESLPSNIISSISYQQFNTMTAEEKIQVAKRMSTDEKNQMLIQYAKIENTSKIYENMNNDTVDQSIQKIRGGLFIGVEDGIHNVEGTATIIPLIDNSTIIRLENLMATNGPDLHIYLATDNTATDFVDVGKLKANNGNQNYDILLGTDLSKYDTVLIWCKAFSVLFGSADLRI